MKNDRGRIIHWSKDKYWTDAIDEFHKLREDKTTITLDIAEIERIAFYGDSPAYRLLEAMHSVWELEGMDGSKGAPRLMLGLIAALEKIKKQPAADGRPSHPKAIRRPTMNFHEIGIPSDSILKFKDSTAEVRVNGARTVEFNGETCSLTSATKKILNLPSERSLQPSPYWTFNGKSIKSIYELHHNKKQIKNRKNN